MRLSAARVVGAAAVRSRDETTIRPPAKVVAWPVVCGRGSEPTAVRLGGIVIQPTRRRGSGSSLRQRGHATSETHLLVEPRARGPSGRIPDRAAHGTGSRRGVLGHVGPTPKSRAAKTSRRPFDCHWPVPDAPKRWKGLPLAMSIDGRPQEARPHGVMGDRELLGQHDQSGGRLRANARKAGVRAGSRGCRVSPRSRSRMATRAGVGFTASASDSRSSASSNEIGVAVVAGPGGRPRQWRCGESVPATADRVEAGPGGLLSPPPATTSPLAATQARATTSRGSTETGSIGARPGRRIAPSGSGGGGSELLPITALPGLGTRPPSTTGTPPALTATARGDLDARHRWVL